MPIQVKKALNPDLTYVLDSIASMTKTRAWIRLGTTVVLLVTAIWGAIVWRINYKSIRINLSSDIYATLHPILYAISLVAVGFGFATAISSLRSPGNRDGWVPTTLLAVLAILCVGCHVRTLLAGLHSLINCFGSSFRTRTLGADLPNGVY